MLPTARRTNVTGSRKVWYAPQGVSRRAKNLRWPKGRLSWNMTLAGRWGEALYGLPTIVCAAGTTFLWAGGGMADAGDLKSPSPRGVWVRLPPGPSRIDELSPASPRLVDGSTPESPMLPKHPMVAQLLYTCCKPPEPPASTQLGRVVIRQAAQPSRQRAPSTQARAWATHTGHARTRQQTQTTWV